MTLANPDPQEKGLKLPLLTPRLILRDLVPEDISRIIGIVSHPEFTGYRKFRPSHIPDDVQDYIEEAIRLQHPSSTTGERDIYRLAVCLKNGQKQVIGICVFHGWNLLSDDNNQIGYFIDPEYQGHGYATEAVRFVLEPYFAQYPERPVYATLHPSNMSSQKVLEKLGFLEYGTKTIDVHTDHEPRLIYSLIASNLTSSDFE